MVVWAALAGAEAERSEEMSSVMVVKEEYGEVERQSEMKSCRRGFIRCRAREEPWGSHQVAARALKWEISSGLTEEEEGPDELAELWLECHRCVVADGDDVVGGVEHCDVGARRAIVFGFRKRRAIVGANWRSGDVGSILMFSRALRKLGRASV